jgi:hypothetical protein
MKLLRLRPEAGPHQAGAIRSTAAGGLLLALVAALFATQAIGQTRLTREVSALPESSTDRAQVNAVPSSQAPAAFSAPVPTTEEAGLAVPKPISFSALAATQAGSSGSTESSSQSMPPTSPPAAVKTKRQHRGMGVALAIVGSVTLAAGVTAFAIGESNFCANEKSGGCPEAKDAGLVLMPVGGAVAVTGFYFTFHR